MFHLEFITCSCPQGLLNIPTLSDTLEGLKKKHFLLYSRLRNCQTLHRQQVEEIS